MRPRAYIFSMWHCLVIPYINPVIQAPGVQTDRIPRGPLPPIDLE